MNCIPINTIVTYVILYLIMLYAMEYYASRSIRNLTNSGWVLFYSPDCRFCEKQLKDLGSQSKWLKKVNCNKRTDLCEDNKVNAYPTWLNTKTGKRYEGFIEKEKIVETLNNV